jgi:predicted DNA-binding protein (MmcQ/YjbR family)
MTAPAGSRKPGFDSRRRHTIVYHAMREEFVDRHCRALPRAERVQPFGTGAVVWRINGHMFAFYAEDGAGLSVRCANLTRALAVIRKTRPASAPYKTGGDWVVLPWETAPEELRQRLVESYHLVRRDWPRASGPPARDG